MPLFRSVTTNEVAEGRLRLATLHIGHRLAGKTSHSLMAQRALEFGRFSQERRLLDPDRSSFLGNQQGKQAFRVL